MTYRRQWFAVLAGVVAAVIVWVVAVPISGADLEVTSGGSSQHIGIVSIVVVSLIVGLLATLVRLGLVRANRARAGNGQRAWVILASIILLISLLGPAGAVTAGAGWSLAAMHVAVGTTLIVGLRRIGPKR